MNDLILIKSGALADKNGRTTMPSLQYGAVGSEVVGSELGYRTDKKELYIGTRDGNVRLCGANDVSEINGKINNVLTRMNSMDTEIAGIRTEISNINTKLTEIAGVIEEINSRLDVLETPEAPGE